MKKTDPIHEILQRWGEENAPSDRETSQLVARVQRKISAETAPAVKHLSLPPLLFPCFGSLAAAALVFIGFVIVKWADNGNKIAPCTFANFAIATPEIEAKSRLFQEMDMVFGPNFDWIAEIGSQVQIGLTDSGGHPTGAQSEGDPILLKIALVRNLEGDHGPGSVVWQNELVAREGRFVSFNPTPQNPHNKLTLWLYSINGAKKLVDFELDVQTPSRVFASSADNVIIEGKSKRVFKTCVDGEIYEMHMIASRLSPPQLETWEAIL